MRHNLKKMKEKGETKVEDAESSTRKQRKFQCEASRRRINDGNGYN